MKLKKLDVSILILLFSSVIVYSPPRSADIIQANVFNVYNIPRIVGAIVCVWLIAQYLILNGVNLKYINKPLAYVYLYWLVGLVSLVSTKFDSYGTVKYFEYTVAILAIIYFSTRYTYDQFLPIELINYARKIYIFFLGTVFLGMIISPARALTQQSEFSELRNAVIPYILRGYIMVFSQTQVGYMSAFILFFYFVKYFELGLKLYELGIIFFAGFACVLAQSRMSWIGLFMALTIYFLFLNSKRFMAIFCFSSVMLCMVIFSENILRFILRGQSTSSFTSISGRSNWWSYSINIFKNSTFFEKLIGHGFAIGEKRVAYASSLNMGTLDSDFFGSLASNGLIGLFCICVIWVLTLLSICKSIFFLNNNLIPPNQRLFLIFANGIKIMFIIKMFTVTTLGLSNPDFILFLICLYTDNFFKNIRVMGIEHAKPI